MSSDEEEMQPAIPVVAAAALSLKISSVLQPVTPLWLWQDLLRITQKFRYLSLGRSIEWRSRIIISTPSLASPFGFVTWLIVSQSQSVTCLWNHECSLSSKILWKDVWKTALLLLVLMEPEVAYLWLAEIYCLLIYSLAGSQTWNLLLRIKMQVLKSVCCSI